MKQILVMMAVLVGCSNDTRKAAPDPADEKLITDPIVEKAIREELKKPTGELTKADLEKVTLLILSYTELTEVPKELENLTQLRKLYLWNNKLTDVKSLKKFTKLERLNLSGNQLTELPKGLEKLTKLRALHLGDNKLTDVKDLAKLTQLTSLSLNANKLTSVKGLENLTQLEYLELQKNQLNDVKGLEKLTQLEYLDLENNPALTKAQIDELQKALPKCTIIHNATK